MKKSRHDFSRWTSCFALLMLGLLTGCGSSGDDAAAPGTVSVSLTDAPACGYEEVNVTVNKVRVHQSSSVDDKAAGWTDISLNPPRTINLLDFNDPTQPVHVEPLGLTPLEPGHYTQLRLVLDRNNGNQPTANWIVLEGQDPNNPNNRIPLDTPSAIRSGIKLIHEFTVNSGERVDLLLDFDACKSIVLTGNGQYQLKPVIRVIPFALNGIEGFLNLALFPQQVNASHAVVSAQVNGQVVRSTIPNAVTGEFFLAHLAPDNYDVVMTADDHATVVVSGVPVSSATSVTKISDSATPFTLPASSSQTINGTVTLNPPDDEATVIVAGKQTLDPGPTVTVKSQVGSTISGNPVGDYSYTLTLPTEAPLLASYGALPITPSSSAQAAVAKIYTVRGSASTDTTVYTIQNPAPSAKDITVVANQTQSFTLSPP
ncbi:MAG TPA: DUF4382 domain-containing protein [Nitrospira sp.]|nr:DUF4382 domain-containing protein [Nitrospira sp.]